MKKKKKTFEIYTFLSLLLKIYLFCLRYTVEKVRRWRKLKKNGAFFSLYSMNIQREFAVQQKAHNLNIKYTFVFQLIFVHILLGGGGGGIT